MHFHTLYRASIASLILCAGCAGPLTYTKVGGVDLQQFRRDNYACTQESRTTWAAGGSGIVGASIMTAAAIDAHNRATRLHKMCMEARGYEAHVLQDGEKTIQ